MTMPVVPRIDNPPIMPRRALSVFAASASPPGMAIITARSGAAASQLSAASASAAEIIARGPGLMAGSPTASGRPGRVTRPTPGPAWKVMPLPADPRAMRHVGIVAGVLDDAGACRALRQLLERQREARLLAARQADRDGIGEGAGQQRLARRARRRGRAGPGGP